MGFFSWKTSDTNESIMNVHSGRTARTTYMLRPDYQEPYEEPAYDGYGEFGGKDAFVHLAEMNLPEDRRAGMTEDQLRDAGGAYLAGYYELVSDGSKHQIFHNGADLIDPAITIHPVTYDQPVAAFGGRCANDMIAEGLLVERHFQIDRPLKFSFERNADYNRLPAAQDCPLQGFFDDE
jgi:hypothetical protein